MNRNFLILGVRRTEAEIDARACQRSVATQMAMPARAYDTSCLYVRVFITARGGAVTLLTYFVYVWWAVFELVGAASITV